jgi:hypothetical protein
MCNLGECSCPELRHAHSIHGAHVLKLKKTLFYLPFHLEHLSSRIACGNPRVQCLISLYENEASYD